MPVGSSSRVLSRIQDHNKSLDRDRSIFCLFELGSEWARIESQQKKGSVAVGGALQEQVKDPQSNLTKGCIPVQVLQQQLLYGQ